MTNIIPFVLKEHRTVEDMQVHDELEVILISNHEETRQVIKVALGYDVRSYGQV